jgi:DNA-binding transcriptional LysR family regulator
VGIGASTEQFAGQFLKTGELVRVLPEWSFPTVTAWAVFPGRKLMPAKTRVFLDMLEAAFDAGG